MSTLLEQASLVLIPSGYKEDVVYSQIPTSGAGDLSFTRASNGTRVNSAGLVEVCPWNLLQQSETFDNSYWAKYISAVTANATTAPNGTTTADKLEYTSASGVAVLYATSTAFANGVYTLSCYAKKGNTNFLQIGFTLGTGDKIANFNLNTGVISTTSSGVTASIESVGDGWYRCIMSLTTDINTPNVFINSINGASGEFIYIWGAQLNIGSTAKPYFPTTDRLNVPRLTYQNGGGGCPSLLLEKQSTNLVIQSQALTISTVNVGYTATDNNATSPDGTQNAARVLEDTGTLHLIQKPYSVGSTTDYYTASFFVKSISRAKGKIVYGLDGAPYNSIDASFDLTAQTISSPTASGSGAVAGSSKIENFGNGWFRVSISGIVGVSGTHYTRLVGLNDSGSDTYTGDPSKGFYAWGFQGEAGTYPTSYIPTTSASATRVSDVAFKTSASALIGTSQGVVFIDFFGRATSTNSRILTITGGAEELLIFMEPTGTGNIGIFGTYTGLNYIDIGGANDKLYKLAYAWKTNDYALYVNGTAITLTQSASVYSSLDRIDLNQAQSGAEIGKTVVKNLVLFPTRLTNAELASLTTI